MGGLAIVFSTEASSRGPNPGSGKARPSKSRAKKAHGADEAPRGRVWARLSRDELDVIARFEAPHRRRSKVVEDALRRFLKIVDRTGRFVPRKATTITERRQKSTFPACHFSVDPEVANKLNEVAKRRGWVKVDLVRQAILAYDG
jgi:hypothetical protein